MNTGNKTGNSYQSADLIELLKRVKLNTMKDTNVCKLAVLESIKSDGYFCKDLNTSETIICHSKLKTVDVNVNDIVCILCTDVDYSFNLNLKQTASKTQTVLTKVYHNINYGIIIGVI